VEQNSSDSPVRQINYVTMHMLQRQTFTMRRQKQRWNIRRYAKLETTGMLGEGNYKAEDEYGAMVEWYWQGKLEYWEKNIIQRRW
jgi:hypothetical protein